EATFTATTLADTQAPVAEITFPPPVSMTAHEKISVRGTAVDDYSEIENLCIRVNQGESCIDAQSDDGFANWSVMHVPLAEGENAIKVIVTDSLGQMNENAAQVMVKKDSLNNVFPNDNHPYEGLESGALRFQGDQRHLLTVQGFWGNEPLL